MSLDGTDPLEFYLRELRKVRPLGKREETDLLRHVQSQDELAESAIRRLIEANLSLVVSIARRQSLSNIYLLDLIQKGNEGLLLALQTFAESSSGSSSAHAATCIESAILKAVAESQSAHE